MLGTFYFLLWHLTHRFRGMDHDGQLYALQALARLRPELYGNDIFFRYGSQDSFTIFTSLYAPVVDWLGLDLAAGLLTFSLTCGFFVAAWHLARRLGGAQSAWLAVGLMIVVDLYYGGFDVFKTAEEFLTARLPAELLGVVAMVAIVAGRWGIAATCALVAALVHPLMAAPVLLLVALDKAGPGRRAMLVMVFVAAVAACFGFARFATVGPLRLMDEAWIEVVRSRSYYLFPTTWPMESWGRIAVQIVTLALAAQFADFPRARWLQVNAGVAGVLGILLALLSNWLPLEPLVQGQPWRWLWVTGVVALMSLPSLLGKLWQVDETSRTAAVLLVAGWLLRDSSGALLAGSAMLLMHTVGRRNFPPGLMVWLRRGTILILAIWTVSSAVEMRQWNLDLGQEPPIVEALRALLGFVPLAALVVAAAWHTAVRQSACSAIFVFAALVGGLALLTAPTAFGSWSRYADRTDGSFAAFADWRQHIPEGTEVLWLWDPLPTWLILQRPSYLSVSQSAGLLFSRPLAMEIDRRAESMRSLGDKAWLIAGGPDARPPPPLSDRTLAMICRDPKLGFVVSSADIEGAIATREWPRKGQYVRLFDCRTWRIGGG